MREPGSIFVVFALQSLALVNWAGHCIRLSLIAAQHQLVATFLAFGPFPFVAAVCQRRRGSVLRLPAAAWSAKEETERGGDGVVGTGGTSEGGILGTGGTGVLAQGGLGSRGILGNLHSGGAGLEAFGGEGVNGARKGDGAFFLAMFLSMGRSQSRARRTSRMTTRSTPRTNTATTHRSNRQRC